MNARDETTYYEVRCPTKQGGCNRRQPQDLEDGGATRGPCVRCGVMLEARVIAGEVHVQITAPKRQKLPQARWQRYYSQPAPRVNQH